MTVDTQSSVGPLGYWAGCYRKYATVTGRARRAEYWWFTLFNLILYVVLVVLGMLVAYLTEGDTTLLGVLVGAYLLAVFLPTLAVTCRRLHDAGLSGWWQLLGIVPLAGIAVFVMTLLEGTPGPNRYGPNPR